MIGCLLILAATAATAPAHREVPDVPTPSPADCEKQFVAYDADRNGTLSYEEYAKGQWGQLRFASAPTDAQIAGHMKGYRAQAAAADANRDKQLSRAEHRAWCQSGRALP